MKEKVVLAIGRWMPIHLGHKSFLVNLARQFDRLVIGIGSCYENGTPRNCIPAVEREKLLRKILRTEGIPDEKIRIIPVEDRETFEEWIDDVMKICAECGVTHFCTGNKEDILNVLDEKGICMNLEMINPEEGSDFPYHATDVRNAIMAQDAEFLKQALPSEIIDDVIRHVSQEIIAANRGEGKQFIPGRQTVDMVFSVRDGKKTYTLIGRRNRDKIDFPGCWAIPGGGIQEFESPVDAIARVFYLETGLKLEIVDNACEPALVRVEGMQAQMHFVGIYASEDRRINGSRGGGSQCFAILIDGSPEQLSKVLFSRHDLEELTFVPVQALGAMKLAFEQKTMVFDALNRLGVDYGKEEALAVMDEEGNPTGRAVSRKEAHEKGILHGAVHTYIYREYQGALQLLLQRRSHNKDSFADCLDISSAGHMEAGTGFPETAVKELEEELGLKLQVDTMKPMLRRRFSNITEQNGKQFNDQEIVEIYLLRMDELDLADLKLQEEEVSEVLWMELDTIARRLEQEDPELCLDRTEFLEVYQKLRNSL